MREEYPKFPSYRSLVDKAIWPWETVGMKKFLRLLFLLAGVGAVIYIVTQKQTEARRVWDEVLAKIPLPDGCSDCCCSKE